MQPESKTSIVDRMLGWWRGLSGKSSVDQEARPLAGTPQHASPATTDTAVKSATAANSHQAAEEAPSATSGQAGPEKGTTAEDVAPTGSDTTDVTSSTGASHDEFSTGGYTPGPIDQHDVEAAADPGDETTPPDPVERAAVASDSPVPGDAPTTIAQHNDESGPNAERASGDPFKGSGDAEDRGTGAAETAIVMDPAMAEAAEGIVSDYIPDPDPDAAREAGMTPSFDQMTPDPGDDDVRGIGDLGADELGSLEEMEEDALAFTSDMSDSFDENSSPDLSIDGDSIDSVGDTVDYTSAANQDLGMRIVDEDQAGLTWTNEAISDLAGIDEPDPVDSADNDDARPLADFTQERSGFASATVDSTNLELDGADEGRLFGVSDIDISDLSYLDEADDKRFAFAASDTPLESERPEPDRDTDSTKLVADDIGASPTGVIDDDGTAVVPAPEHATGSATESAARGSGVSGPRSGVRGDDTGSCPPEHPIKGNSTSKIYHLPDLASYAGTKAGWCFATEDDAVAAGYRPPAARKAGGRTGNQAPKP